MLPALSVTIVGLADWLLQYAVALAAVGILAMALLESWKSLTESRLRFQLREFVSWFAFQLKANGRHSSEGTKEQRAAKPAAALAQLIAICTGLDSASTTEEARRLLESSGSITLLRARSHSPAHAVFALKSEETSAALQEAADIALADPESYPELFDVLTCAATPKDVEAWRSHARAEKSDPARAKEVAATYSRIRHAVVRRIDAFQFYTESKWTNRNQFVAIVLGAMIMYLLLTIITGFEASLPNVPLSLLGGLLAPVAKDLVTALHRLKSGG